MADTIQAVRWALEFTCPLRAGEAVHDPIHAVESISDAQLISEHLYEGAGDLTVIDDFCVISIRGFRVPKESGRTPERESARQTWLEKLLKRAPKDVPEFADIPQSGFVISEKLAAIGGKEGLVKLCQHCAANTHAPKPAGCAGGFYLLSLRHNDEDLLRSSLNRLGLQRRFADAFLSTKPLWYGLWARSPLSVEACQILGALFTHMMRQR